MCDVGIKFIHYVWTKNRYVIELQMAEKVAQPCRVSAFLDVYVEMDLCQTIKVILS